MRKKMEKLAGRLNTSVMYFTESPFNFSGYEGYKYFLCWQNTHKVYKAFETQAEAIEELEELVESKIAYDGSHAFQVAD